MLGGAVLALAFAVPGGNSARAGCDDADTECKQKQYDKTQEELKKAEKKYGVIQQDLNQINSSLTSTQQVIQRVQNLLNQTTQTIGQKEQEITNLGQQLELEKKVLSGLIREMYYSGTIPLAEVMLVQDNITSLFQGNDNLFSTQEKMQGVIQEINDVKAKVADEKISLEDAKKDHETLLQIKNQQKQVLVSDKIETQNDLEDQQATIDELQKKLRELQSDLNILTGKSYNAKDIQDAIEFTSKKTGVPKGVLYGFLKQETNLGVNVGQCTYSDVEKVSVAGYKKYGKKYQASIDRLYRRWELFKGIASDLGYSKNKKVSCTIPFSKAGPNQGGAMGVAQFMSDTWLNSSLQKQIKSFTGHSEPDPWNLTDGVMAMGIKVRDLGGTSSSSSAIKKSTTGYYGAFSQGYYNTVLYWSKNYSKLFD